jgi:hypothetical protein
MLAERARMVDVLAALSLTTDLVSDAQVAAEIRLTAEFPNGNRIDEMVIHLWTLAPTAK